VTIIQSGSNRFCIVFFREELPSREGEPVEAGKMYKVALTDFLLTGGEANLDFLNKDNPDIVKVYPVFTSLDDSRSDVRRAIIRYMEGL